jgi:hypothetical protein
MPPKRTPEEIQRDRELIDSLGGVPTLTKRLGYEKAGGIQRVQNWTVRGIPDRVKLQHPEIFLQSAKKNGGKKKGR